MQEMYSLNGRILLGGGAAVLLALPLILLLGLLLKPRLPLLPPSGVSISPMLDSEQRMRLTTYLHACQSKAECEPPLSCLFEYRSGRSYCTDSQCTTDAQCREGMVCRVLAARDPGSRVRICVALGVRQQGEGCESSPPDQDSACAAGLICGGHDHSWCAQPCSPGSPAQCSQGFFCADVEPEPVCLPTCEKRGCPEGQRCVRYDAGASVCARVHGRDCQASACPEGRECLTQESASHPGEAWMECLEPCGAGTSTSCGAGKTCDVFHCVTDCDPHLPGGCPEGYRCAQRGPETTFACRPDW